MYNKFDNCIKYFEAIFDRLFVQRLMELMDVSKNTFWTFRVI